MKTLSMTSRAGALIALVAIMSCSRSGDNARSTAAPTAPSSLAASQPFVDPATDRLGAMAATFPTPEDALAFRQVLEAKFRAEGRPAQTTFVNAEGVIVWTLEYLRYRASGCSQAEAIDKVFTQIDRRGVPAPCTATISETFPSQSEAQAFRQQLELKYRDGLGAPPNQTFVPQASEVLYTIEFVRYTQSGCSSASSYERVFVQIDGRGVEPDCRQEPLPCRLTVSPSTLDIGSAGGAFSTRLSAETEACGWKVQSDAPWLTGLPTGGTGSATIAVNATANTGSQSRAGRLTITSDAGGTSTSVPPAILQVNQAPTNTTPPGPGPGPTPGPCTYTVSPTTVNAIPQGGTYGVAITTQAGCAWSARSTSTFIVLESGQSGVGSGTARFIVGRNDGAARQGAGEVSWSTGSQALTFVQPALPLEAFITAPVACNAGSACRFDGSRSTGAITEYRWNFGDNTSGSGVSPSKTYAFGIAPYPDDSIDVTVTLTVIGPAGSSTTSVTVTVFDNGGLLAFGGPIPERVARLIAASPAFSRTR